MDVPPNLFRQWEQQHTDAQQRARMQEQARERSVVARIWLERAYRAIRSTETTEGDR